MGQRKEQKHGWFGGINGFDTAEQKENIKRYRHSTYKIHEILYVAGIPATVDTEMNARIIEASNSVLQRKKIDALVSAMTRRTEDGKYQNACSAIDA